MLLAKVDAGTPEIKRVHTTIDGRLNPIPLELSSPFFSMICRVLGTSQVIQDILQHYFRDEQI